MDFTSRNSSSPKRPHSRPLPLILKPPKGAALSSEAPFRCTMPVRKRRATWPARVVWKQDSDVTHSRFYWLASPADAIHPNEIIAAHVTGQTITLEPPATGRVILRLSDDLLDLDKTIKVMAGPRLIFSSKVPRTLIAITTSLTERADPDTVATVLLPVSW